METLGSQCQQTQQFVKLSIMRFKIQKKPPMVLEAYLCLPLVQNLADKVVALGKKRSKIIIIKIVLALKREMTLLMKYQAIM